MKIRGSRRLIKSLGLALAVATIAAPSALAVLPTDSGALTSAQPRLGVAPSGYAPINTRVQLVEPRGYAPINTRVQLVEPRGYAPINTRVRPDLSAMNSEVASASSSFDWGDAGIGAGIMAALVGFGAAILAGRQTRRSRLSAA
jgi:hypothetical protein